MKKFTIILIVVLLLSFTSYTQAGLFKEHKNLIYYHCADWGPNEDGSEEKIYFVKQIIFEEDGSRFGNIVYFCSMNPDGSDKQELAKLFEDTEYYLDINGNTSFMDICYKTKQAAIAFSAGAKECTGLWLINLDGTGFKRIVEQEWRKDFQARIYHPSWFPDGTNIVYQERWCHISPTQFYIVRSDKDGKNKIYLTNEEDGKYNKYPVVSPNGKQIAYTHRWYNPDAKGNEPKGGRNLWLMEADGSNKRMLYDNKRHCADYPEWSPDGNKIYVVNVGDFTIIDAVTGQELFSQLLKYYGNVCIPRKIHWSDTYGYLMDGGGFYGIIKNDFSAYDNLGTSGGYVTTKRKRNLSKYEYRWGKGLKDE